MQRSSFSRVGRRHVVCLLGILFALCCVVAEAARSQAVAQAITLSGHGGKVRSAAFSPDGTRVLTASWDRTARIVPLDARVPLPTGPDKLAPQ
jgi:hypothetical protein